MDLDADEPAAPEGTPGTGDLVIAYGRRVRGTPGLGDPKVVSYAGLWLLLASLSPAVPAAFTARLAEVLGVTPDEGATRAGALLRNPHPALGAALGAWARGEPALAADLVAALPVSVEPLPAQNVLDRWAAERTRGLIAVFPITVTPQTLLILASALVAQVTWAPGLGDDEGGWLILNGGLQALVHTESAGVVAIAMPQTADAVDVVSVIAADGVPPSAVLEAVDEVTARLNNGRIMHQTAPTPTVEDGHAWSVRTETRSFRAGHDPGPDAEEWRSVVPRWKSDSTMDLSDAPGVREVAAGLAQGMTESAGDMECAQSAMASYNETGFSAAAVTAMAIMTSVPSFVRRSVRCVEIRFDRPHAVVAIARGGAWEGVPIFHAWVDPAQRLTEADRTDVESRSY